MIKEPEAVKLRPNKHTSDFTELMKTVKDLGLLRKRQGLYLIRFITINVALIGVIIAMVMLNDSLWQLGVAFVLALILGQVMFLGHDAAHSQIFKSNKYNNAASLIIANFYAGMSFGWWNHKHSRHHAKPNQVNADPDINSDVILFHTQSLTETKKGFKSWLFKNQGWFFFPLLLLEGLNLHFAGLKTVFSKGKINKRALEITLILTRLGGYIALVFLCMPVGLGFAFLAVQMGVFGVYMGGVFAPNHKGMPIVPENSRIDFLRRQVLMSRNIKGGRVIDFFMGGLNYQVEHHLFPSMPRAHLRKVQPIVKEFCESKKVPYTETTLLSSYMIVVNYLNEVGLAARDPFQCPLATQLRTVDALTAP